KISKADHRSSPTTANYNNARGPSARPTTPSVTASSERPDVTYRTTNLRAQRCRYVRGGRAAKMVFGTRVRYARSVRAFGTRVRYARSVRAFANAKDE